MNIQRFWKKFAVAFMALVLLLPCLAIPAFAYNPIDTSRETSLTVHFGEGSTDFSGVEFRIYRVADVSESGEFTLAGDFVDYPISLENLDNAGWRALAQTLAGYVARDHLDPYKTAKTDKNGRAFFDHLPTGLYLVMGDSYEKGRTTYTPDPFALCLPNPDGETGEWIYDVEASCKYDSEYDPPHGGGGDDDPSSGGGGGTPVTVTRRVQKIWDDSGHTRSSCSTLEGWRGFQHGDAKRKQQLVLYLVGVGCKFQLASSGTRCSKRIYRFGRTGRRPLPCNQHLPRGCTSHPAFHRGVRGPALGGKHRASA